MCNMSPTKIYRPWAHDVVMAEETTDIQQSVTGQCEAYTCGMSKDSESSSESGATSGIGSHEPIRPANHYRDNEINMRQSPSTSSSEYLSIPSSFHMVRILSNQSEVDIARSSIGSSSSSSVSEADAPRSAFSLPTNQYLDNPALSYYPPVEMAVSENAAYANAAYTNAAYVNAAYAYAAHAAVVNQAQQLIVSSQYLHQETASAKDKKKLRLRTFKCNWKDCRHKFSNNGQLKGHYRTHTGERPYKCDEAGCGKAFTRNEELTRHKKIHTGLRPYVCLCGKDFGRKDHLRKHQKTHDNQGPQNFLPVAVVANAQAVPLLSHFYYA